MSRPASEKVGNYDVAQILKSVDIDNRLIALNFTSELPTDTDVDTLVSTITEKVESGVKPSESLKKQLGRIALHEAQLIDAVESLLSTYGRMVTPQKRMSAAQKARVDMLQAMDDNMLKKFATIYLPDEIMEYILPDDRDNLVERLCDYLAKRETVTESM